jgi:phosphonate transport system substrate-binding protein
MKSSNRFAAAILAALVIPSGALAQQSAIHCVDPPALRFSVVPKKSPVQQFEEYRPLIMRLEAVTGRPVEIVFPSSYSSVVEGLLSGSVHLAELGPASYAQAKARDARVLAFATLARERDRYSDSRHYRSLLVAHPRHAERGVPGLRNSVLLMTDPASTSGALYPRRRFSREIGMAVDKYFSRISYVGSHDRAIDAVAAGIADAAFVSSSRLEEALRRKHIAEDDLIVLWQSSPIPYDPFVYLATLCHPLRQLISRSFLESDDAMRQMFGRLNLRGIEAVDDSAYHEVRAVYAEDAAGSP